MTAVGQMTFVIALPLLARLFTPAHFGLFTVYLSIVNICGPIAGMKFTWRFIRLRDPASTLVILGAGDLHDIGSAALAPLRSGVFGAHLPGALAPASAALGL